jgi:hypothetical protein
VFDPFSPHSVNNEQLSFLKTTTTLFSYTGIRGAMVARLTPDCVLDSRQVQSPKSLLFLMFPTEAFIHSSIFIVAFISALFFVAVDEQ